MGNKAIKMNQKSKILYVFLRQFLIVESLTEKKMESANLNKIYTFIIPYSLSVILNDSDFEMKYYDRNSGMELTLHIPLNFKESYLERKYNKIFDKEYIDYTLSQDNKSSFNGDVILRCEKNTMNPIYIIINQN